MRGERLNERVRRAENAPRVRSVCASGPLTLDSSHSDSWAAAEDADGEEKRAPMGRGSIALAQVWKAGRYWYRSSIRSVGSVYLGEVFTRQVLV